MTLGESRKAQAETQQSFRCSACKDTGLVGISGRSPRPGMSMMEFAAECLSACVCRKGQDLAFRLEIEKQEFGRERSIAYYIQHFTQVLSGEFRVTTIDFGEIERFTEIANPEDTTDLERLLQALPYQEFLQTFYWRAIKAHIVHRRGAICGDCRATDRVVDVHHASYRFHGREHQALADLQVLCRACHEQRHSKPGPIEGDELSRIISDLNRKIDMNAAIKKPRGRS
jgi:hypothetical protein